MKYLAKTAKNINTELFCKYCDRTSLKTILAFKICYLHHKRRMWPIIPSRNAGNWILNSTKYKKQLCHKLILLDEVKEKNKK
jgi:hypothetical protein